MPVENVKRVSLPLWIVCDTKSNNLMSGTFVTGEKFLYLFTSEDVARAYPTARDTTNVTEILDINDLVLLIEILRDVLDQGCEWIVIMSGMDPDDSNAFAVPTAEAIDKFTPADEPVIVDA